MRIFGFFVLAALFTAGLSWLAWRLRRGRTDRNHPPVPEPGEHPLDVHWNALVDAHPDQLHRIGRVRRSCLRFLAKADPNDELAVAIRRSLPLWAADVVPADGAAPRRPVGEILELFELLAAQAELRLAAGTGRSSAYAADRAYLEEIERRYLSDLR